MVTSSILKLLQQHGIVDRRTWLQWVRKNHPDKGGDTAVFQEISNAYAEFEANKDVLTADVSVAGNYFGKAVWAQAGPFPVSAFHGKSDKGRVVFTINPFVWVSVVSSTYSADAVWVQAKVLCHETFTWEFAWVQVADCLQVVPMVQPPLGDVEQTCSCHGMHTEEAQLTLEPSE